MKEALTVIEMVLRRTHLAAFRNWRGAHSADVVGIGIVVADLQTQLLGYRGFKLPPASDAGTIAFTSSFRSAGRAANTTRRRPPPPEALKRSRGARQRPLRHHTRPATPPHRR